MSIFRAPTRPEVRQYLTADNGWTDEEVDDLFSWLPTTDEAMSHADWEEAVERYKAENPEPWDEEGVRYPDVEVELTGESGNAFMIIGKVQRALRRANVDPTTIQEYARAATAGDYDHLLQTTMKWVTVL